MTITKAHLLRETEKLRRDVQTLHEANARLAQALEKAKKGSKK